MAQHNVEVPRYDKLTDAGASPTPLGNPAPKPPQANANDPALATVEDRRVEYSSPGN
jgi:hypothetical protein